LITRRELREARRVLANQVRTDPVNNLLLPLVGAGWLLFLGYRGWVSWDLIRLVVCHDGLC
jgi:hypothetical protein